MFSSNFLVGCFRGPKPETPIECGHFYKGFGYKIDNFLENKIEKMFWPIPN